MSAFPPIIGATGIYNLKPPFNTLPTPQVQYKCVAVRNIKDVINSEIDLLQTVYIANSLTEEDYISDLNDNANIITLQNVIGHIVMVPDTYINGIPDINGVPYSPMIIGINLGSISDKIDLSSVKQKLADIVVEYIGVNIPDVKEMKSGVTLMFSENDHRVLEVARLARIDSTETDYAKYLRAKAERDLALLKVTELENYIRTNM